MKGATVRANVGPAPAGTPTLRAGPAQRLRLPSFLLIALLVGGCGEGGPAVGTWDEGEPEFGGTAISSRVNDFDAFNSFVSTDYDTGQVLKFMLYMPLVRLDADLEYQPYLAESLEIDDDGLWVSFRLREGVAWHDGTPVTVEDVIWSVEMYRNPDLAYANVQYFGFVDRVERADDRTVVFHFTARHSDPLANFLEWEPMPRHVLADVPAAQMRTAPFNRNPLGNGPFRFVSWTTNQQVVFEANPDFVLGRPRLDRVVFRIIPDQTTELTELLTGRIDMMRAVPPAEASRLESSPAARLIPYSSRSYTFLAWNTTNPFFADARVRQALSMGIDRQQIVDALLYGFGRVAVVDVLPFQWQFSGDLEPLPYAPDEARRLLAEAGWADTDGDGILDKDGRPFRFTLETNQGNAIREDIVVIVQNDLRRIGIDVQPRLAEWNTLIARLREKRFEAVVSGWSVDFKFDPTETFGCDAGVYNYPSYCNPEADSIVATALRTLDQDQARPLWERYQRIIHEEQPYTFLYYLNERLGVSNRLRGVEADARGHLVSVAEWWIPAELRR